MKIIDKIEIKYYRSLKAVSLKEINDLNIFSGRNDTGKSNVLKALNLFFNKPTTNFHDDFNKERLNDVRMDSIKGKQFINIKITFLNPGSYKTLPKRFYVSKSWDRNGNLLTPKDNIESLFKLNKIDSKSLNRSKGSLTHFLNKIKFTYVPAIKDDVFFSFLIRLLQEAIFLKGNKESESIHIKTEEFNTELQKITKDLEEEFRTVSGVSSSLSFPSEISELFERLIIDTQSGNYTIPMKLRGEGIRMRYIPTILNYISKNTNQYHIWGFDEPENSCEYKLIEEISKDFLDDYIKNAQIFVSTHSFHFISLESKQVSRYRVIKNKEEVNSKIIAINQKNLRELEDEIGILGINEKLKKLYNQLTLEYETIEDTKKKLVEANKPVLLFEGPSDNIHFSLAFKELFGREINSEYKLCNHTISDQGATYGSGAPKINDFLCNHISRFTNENVIIGIFDFDEEGFNEFKALKKSKLFKTITIDDCEFKNILQHKNYKNVFSITLWQPTFRNNFIHETRTKYCYVSTELLYNDAVIPSSNKFYPTLYDKTVYGFTGKKMVFTEKIKDKLDQDEEISFDGFLNTVNLLKNIVEFYNDNT